MSEASSAPRYSWDDNYIPQPGPDPVVGINPDGQELNFAKSIAQAVVYSGLHVNRVTAGQEDNAQFAAFELQTFGTLFQKALEEYVPGPLGDISGSAVKNVFDWSAEHASQAWAPVIQLEWPVILRIVDAVTGLIAGTSSSSPSFSFDLGLPSLGHKPASSDALITASV